MAEASRVAISRLRKLKSISGESPIIQITAREAVSHEDLPRTIASGEVLSARAYASGVVSLVVDEVPIDDLPDVVFNQFDLPV